MALNIWEKCDGEKHISPIKITAWRFIEDQGSTSTRKLVDSVDEQILLEQMIEEVKQPISKDCEGLHLLLYTPFRYPPLPHGSRFGNRYERSLWYGSDSLNTVMAEVAYYRFFFLNASDADFGIVATFWTGFSTQIKTGRAIKLTEKPFSKFHDLISSPSDYSVSQELGSFMRAASVDAFNYQSARDPDKGNNIALFSPAAFAKKQPEANSFQSWQCVTDHRVVEFERTGSINTTSNQFPLDGFLVDGHLPSPAA